MQGDQAGGLRLDHLLQARRGDERRKEAGKSQNGKADRRRQGGGAE